MITLVLPREPDPALLAALAAGQPERFPGYAVWEPTTFVVDSGGPVDAGIHGEAVQMQPPLRFAIRGLWHGHGHRPGALRIRLPEHASGLSPAARELRRRDRLREPPERKISRLMTRSGSSRNGGGEPSDG